MENGFQTLNDFPKQHEWFDKENHYLYLDFREWCNTYLRIGSWNRGLSVEHWNSTQSQWIEEQDDTGIPMLLDYKQFREPTPILFYISEIPIKIALAAKRFQWAQFSLLRLIQNSPEAMELLGSNPILTWLLANAITKGKLSIEQGSKYVFLKRVDILTKCGYQGTESMVKLLSKIKFRGNYTLAGIEYVKKLLSDNSAKEALRHTQEIRGEFLRFFLMSPKIISVKFIDQIINSVIDRGEDNHSDFLHLISIWKDTIRLAGSLGIQQPEKRVSQVRSIEELEYMHDQFTKIINQQNQTHRILRFKAQYGSESLLEYPFAGNADIVPIQTIQDLLKEGAEMHNCVAAYEEKIMSRQCYLYRVICPERATLELIQEHGKIKIGQLKLAYNNEPSEETKRMVRKWVKDQLQNLSREYASEQRKDSFCLFQT